MSEDKIDYAKARVKTPVGRVSFPFVFEPDTDDDSGKEKYRCSLLFKKKTDLTKMKKALFYAAKFGFPGKSEKELKDMVNAVFRDGDGKENLQGYAGHWFVTASSKDQPPVVQKDEDGALTKLTTKQEFYAGCYAVAMLVAAPYGHTKESQKFTKGKKGVTFYLNGLEKKGDGAKFGGGPSVQDMFGDDEDVVNDFEDEMESTGDNPDDYNEDGDDGNGNDDMDFL